MASEDFSRWRTPQPNVPGVGIIASYGWRFWLLVVALGACCGAAASALIELLKLVERLSYGSADFYLYAVKTAPPWRHLAVLLLAALIVIVGLRLLGNMRTSGSTEVSESLWLAGGRVAFWPSIGRGVLSIVTVGMGVSLGREAAPQLAGAATASRLADWASLPVWQRRLLVASGAGAGFAAVYNVPLGGTLLAVEVLLGTLALPLVIPAALTCGTATAVAWITLGTGPTFRTPLYVIHPSQLLWAAALGPVIGILAVLWIRLIARSSMVRIHGRRKYLAPIIVFTALALLSIPYPQLLGNGKDIVQLVIAGNLSVGSAARPAPAQAARDGGVHRVRFAGRAVHADVRRRMPVREPRGNSVRAHVARCGDRQLCADRRRRVPRRIDAGSDRRNGSRPRDDATLRCIDGADAASRSSGATIVARLLGAHSIYSARLRTDPDQVITPAASAAAIASLQALNEGPLPPEMTGPPPEAP